MDIRIIIQQDNGRQKTVPFSGGVSKLRGEMSSLAAMPGVTEITAVDADGQTIEQRTIPEGQRVHEVTIITDCGQRTGKRTFTGTLRQIIAETRRAADEEGILTASAQHKVLGTICTYPRERKATRKSADGSARNGRTYIRLPKAALAMIDGEPGGRSDYIISAIYQKYSREHGRTALHRMLRENASGSERKAIATEKATGKAIRVTSSLWNGKSRGGIPVWVDSDDNTYLDNDKNYTITEING